MVALILERNPEVNFCKRLDVSDIMARVLYLFMESQQFQSEQEAREALYSTPCNGASGTYAYIAKAVSSVLLDGNVNVDHSTGNCMVM